jgi:hypothetical protein
MADITKAVGIYVGKITLDMQRPSVPEGVPVSALIIEGVADIPWPEGVSLAEAIWQGLRQ